VVVCCVSPVLVGHGCACVRQSAWGGTRGGRVLAASHACAAAHGAPRRDPTNGAEVVASRLEQIGRGQQAPAAAAAARMMPLVRMKDTVVFGYLMASSKHGRVDVPDWCARALCVCVCVVGRVWARWLSAPVHVCVDVRLRMCARVRVHCAHEVATCTCTCACTHRRPRCCVSAHRYVNGADPNRRRGSYRSLPDAAAAAPLQDCWHLAEGLCVCFFGGGGLGCV
jgi:hypothetical protein